MTVFSSEVSPPLPHRSGFWGHRLRLLWRPDSGSPAQPARLVSSVSFSSRHPGQELRGRRDAVVLALLVSPAPCLAPTGAQAYRLVARKAKAFLTPRGEGARGNGQRGPPSGRDR